MAEETDGIEEAFEGQIRVLVTAAGQVGERIARAREEGVRRAQARSEQDARQMQARLEAERRAACVELASVYRDEWWAGAGAEQIGRTYQVARAWAREDPEAVRAEQRMREQLRTGYGIDVEDANADPDAVRRAVERALHDREGSDAERNRAAAERAEAELLMQEADREDRRAEQARAAAMYEPDGDERARAAAEAAHRDSIGAQAGDDGLAMYDSAQRRAATAGDLEGQGIDQEIVATRMRGDVSQAKPAAEAVKNGRSRRPSKARGTRGRGTHVQRAGLDR